MFTDRISGASEQLIHTSDLMRNSKEVLRTQQLPTCLLFELARVVPPHRFRPTIKKGPQRAFAVHKEHFVAWNGTRECSPPPCGGQRLPASQPCGG